MKNRFKNNLNGKFIKYEILLFIFITLFIPPAIYSQEKRILFKRFEEGALETGAFSIVQDQQSFLYIGTQNGLLRMDGVNQKSYTYNPKNENSPSSFFIYRIARDQGGKLWLGTSKGLNRFDPISEKFTRYHPDPEKQNNLNNTPITALFIAKNGMIWLGTAKGLRRFDPTTEKFSLYFHETEDPEEESGRNWVNAIYEDRNENLWIGTKKGMDLFNPETEKFIHFNPSKENPNSLIHFNVISFLQDQTGSLWIGTAGGLNRYNPLTEQFEHFQNETDDSTSLSHNQVNVLHMDHKGQIWVGTREGLNRWLPKKKVFISYKRDEKNPFSLTSNRIVSIYTDRTKNLWIGTTTGGGNGGLNLYNKSRVKIENLIFYYEGKHLENPASLIFGEGDAFWFRSFGKGVGHYDPKKGVDKFYAPDPKNPDSLNSNFTSSLIQDQKGIFWISTWGGGLNRFDPRTETFSHYKYDANDPNSVSSDEQSQVFEDSSGWIWVATPVGLNRLDRRTGHFTRFFYDPGNPDSLSNNKTKAIFEDSENRLWITTIGGGLNEFLPGSNTFRRYQYDPKDPNSIPTNRITTITEDEKGNLWMAGGAVGLIQMEKSSGKFSLFSENDVLPTSFIVGVLVDDNGILWLSSSIGIIRFDPETKIFRVYDKNDGIINSIYWAGTTYKSPQGVLYFSGKNIDFFHPDHMRDDPFPPPVVLTSFRKFEKDIDLGISPVYLQNLELSYQDRFFGFEFAALHYLAPEKNQYLYKMEGFDQDWITPKQNYVTYTNLDPGNYTFRVKASNNDGVWNEEGLSLPVKITPPPWQTDGAYALYLILSLFLLFFLIRWIKNKLAKNEVELAKEKKMLAKEKKITEKLQLADRLKDEFLANTSHELRTPLTGITGIAESLLDGIGGKMSPIAAENLSLIVTSGRRLNNLINDILDFSKLRHQDIQLSQKPVSLFQLVEVVLTLSGPLAKGKDLQLLNETPNSLPPVFADEDRLQQILYNLIGNAIKFTKTGVVKVTAQVLEHQEEFLEVTVHDTGIGIPRDKQDKIFQSFEQGDGSTSREYGGTGLGLTVTKQLVELHQGKITVDSEVGRGSQVRFSLPISKEEASTEESLLPTVPLNDIIEGEIETAQMSKTNNESPYTVLVVDDEAVNRQVLINHLSLENFSVLIAEDGQEALQIIEKSGKPDLVLLDIMMPGMTGFETCVKLRENFPVSQLPIIFLTAKNQLSSLLQSFSSGANDFLAKPFFKEELLSRIQVHLTIYQLDKALFGKNQELKELNDGLEDQIKLRTRQLVHSEKMSGLGTLTAGIAHEINNPANVSLGGVGNLQHDLEEFREIVFSMLDEEDEGNQESLEFFNKNFQNFLQTLFHIEGGVKRITSIVADLRTFSRLDEADFKEADIIEGLRVTLNLVKALFEEITFEFQPEEKIQAICWPAQLNQSFLNILLNAAQAISEKTFSGEEKGKISITTSIKKDELEIHFRDNGCGMSLERQDKALDPFFTTKQVGSGIGLGLSTSHGIIEKHKGRIQIESTEGEGTEVSVFISLSLPIEEF